MTPIKCVLYVPTGWIRRSLRRFTFSSSGYCPAAAQTPYPSGCDASAFLDDVESDGSGIIRNCDWDRQDRRWPTVCEACGSPLPSHAEWQVFCDWLYRDASNSSADPVTLMKLPVGALWEQDFGHGPDSIHMLERHRNAQPHSKPHLFCRTPGGVWDMDTKSSNGTGWRVIGTPPLITVKPSILHSRGGWHGWLTDGVLIEC